MVNCNILLFPTYRPYSSSLGYDDLKQGCDSEFPNTHVCTAAEIGIIAQFDSLYQGNFRYLDMAFAFDAQNNRRINDCFGFTSSNDQYGSHCVLKKVGGPVLPQFCPCSMVLPLICCADD